MRYPWPPIPTPSQLVTILIKFEKIGTGNGYRNEKRNFFRTFPVTEWNGYRKWVTEWVTEFVMELEMGNGTYITHDPKNR